MPQFPSLAFSPVWKKFTVGYAALSFNGFSNDITLYSLPPKNFIMDAIVKHSTAFSGGAIATYTVSIGIHTSLTKYTAVFDVLQAVADGTYQATIPSALVVESFANSTNITISAISTVGKLNVATAGSVDVWLLIGQIP